MTITLPDSSPDLRGDGVLLTPWEPQDLPRIVEIAEDAATRTWSGSMVAIRTLADAKRWVDGRAGPGRVDWAVRDPDTGVLIGRAGLHAFRAAPPTGEIGYGVHPAHRRRGVAVAAVRAVTSWAYAELGLTRIELVHDIGNTASCLVATRSGYLLEARERQSMGYPDGRVADAHRHARLVSDPTPNDRPSEAWAAAASGKGIEPVEIAAGAWQLRPPSTAEAADALVMLQDPLTVRWNPAASVVDLESARAWCARGADWSQGDHATFSVLDAVTGRLAGNVSLWHIDLIEQMSASIGYRTAPWARGRGVATTAVQAVTGWAFGALAIERIDLPHDVANLASCRVADKCGYRLEGVLRASWRHHDGTRHDEHLHARLTTVA